MKYLLGLLLFMPLFLSAQSRFNGTWEMKMGTIELSGPPEEYLLENEMYHCITCVPRVDVEMNGEDQHVTGHANFDTIAVRSVDANSVEFIQKKDGKPTFTCTETVSPDGKTMVEEFSETPTSRRVTGHASFTRVSKGPVGSHDLSGSWQMRTIRNVSSTGSLSTYQVIENGMRMSEGGPAVEAKFDGGDYPVEGEPKHTVSLTWLTRTRSNERTSKMERSLAQLA